jgi:hypothetical protein
MITNFQNSMNIMDIKYTCKKGVNIHPFSIFLLTIERGGQGPKRLFKKGSHVSQKILGMKDLRSKKLQKGQF